MLATLMRFSSVGVVTTLVGIAVMMLALAAGFGDYQANITGYAVGLLLSFTLNRRWTFAQSEAATMAEVGRFLIAFGIAFLANFAVLVWGRSIGFAGQPILQLAGMSVYSLFFFFLSRHFVFTPSSPIAVLDKGGRGTIPTSAFFLSPGFIVPVLAVISWVAIRHVGLTHDVIWQLWIARQMSHGAELYKDIMELNPPLWFWSAVPLHKMAEALRVAPRDALIFIVTLAAAASSVTLSSLISTAKAWQTTTLAAVAFLVMVFTSLYDLGQREHWAAMFALPYAALVARRALGKPVPIALALVVGIAGAYGFALKHYFALIPLLLEIWFFVRNRQSWKPFRTETLVVAGAAISYAVATFHFAPAFLEDIVPTVGHAYGGFEAPFLSTLQKPWVFLWVLQITLCLASARHVKREARFPLESWLIVAGVFILAYLVQQKGVSYHAMPATIVLNVATVIVLISLSWARPFLFKAVAALTIAQSLLLSYLIGPYKNWLDTDAAPYLSKLQAGDALFVASPEPMWAWPAVANQDLKWASRYYAYWPIPAIANAEINGPRSPVLDAIADAIKQDATASILCSAPKLILIERQPNYVRQPAAFDVGAFFFGEGELKTYLARYYTPLPPSDTVAAYLRTGNNQPQARPDCPAAWDR